METSGKKVVELNIEDVLPNRFQPRIKFNEEAIIELSKSIKEHGVIQPIVVRPIGDKFEIIAGERRYKASCMANLKTIPAIITDLNDKDSAEVALIENVQRENLTPIEEAISYKKILDMGYITQDALATKLGKTQSTVANKLRLLNLDDEVQEALLNEKISERHARSLLKLTDKQQQKQLLNKIISERLTVRRADEEIDKMINGTEPQEINNEKTSNVELIDELPKDRENPSFKFINMPINESNKDENASKTEEIKPGKFFNILSNEEEKPKEIEEQSAEKIFNFESMFNDKQEKPIINPADNNSLLDELNEIENSINNSNTLPPIFNNTEKIKDEDDEFMDDFIEEEIVEESNEPFENPQEKNEIIQETKIETYPEINNFKDVLNSIRKCSDKIEEAGYTIETEEYDLEDAYQVVFKITKADK